MNNVQYYITKSSIALQPYKALVGQSAAVLSILQLLSPLVSFNEMRKAKSTRGMPFIPFLIIAVLTSLNVRFSQILNDNATFQANLVGFSVSLVYITIYYNYVSPNEKFNHLMQILATAAFIVTVIVYSKYEDPGKIETRFGLILTAMLYCLFALPVLGIYKTLTRKCTRHLPFPMIFSGTLVGFAWLLHGIIINSGFIIAQNLVMLGINLFQLSLFLIYPSEPQPTKKAKSKRKQK